MERAADALARGFPLAEPAWFAVLRALCAVGEGADVRIPVSSIPPAMRTSGAACVAAVLGDACRRLSILGGRDGMPRSLGSVYGSLVTRFVGGLRGKVSRVIKTPGIKSWSNCVAVSRDGCTLLVSDDWGGSNSIHTYCALSGAFQRTIGCWGHGALQFWKPHQVWVASDDHVFVADQGNNRIQVLTPRVFEFHGFVGVGQLEGPSGVCADEHVVCVSELVNRVSVFGRGDGTLLRRLGGLRYGYSMLKNPHGLCFMSKNQHVAVADRANHRITVFSLEGEFIRTVGYYEFNNPTGVACSERGGELIVACAGYDGGVFVFSANDELLHTMERGFFRGVAMHGDAIFAQTTKDDGGCMCMVFT